MAKKVFEDREYMNKIMDEYLADNIGFNDIIYPRHLCELASILSPTIPIKAVREIVNNMVEAIHYSVYFKKRKLLLPKICMIKPVLKPIRHGWITHGAVRWDFEIASYFMDDKRYIENREKHEQDTIDRGLLNKDPHRYGRFKEYYLKDHPHAKDSAIESAYRKWNVLDPIEGT